MDLAMDPTLIHLDGQKCLLSTFSNGIWHGNLWLIVMGLGVRACSSQFHKLNFWNFSLTHNIHKHTPVGWFKKKNNFLFSNFGLLYCEQYRKIFTHTKNQLKMLKNKYSSRQLKFIVLSQYCRKIRCPNLAQKINEEVKLLTSMGEIMSIGTPQTP